MTDVPTNPTLSATTTGLGPPIVTVHASGLSGKQFGRFAAAAADRYTVVCPDLLGVGTTPLPPSFSLDAEVEALLGLLSTTALAHRTPAFVFGHSWGGLVALEAALRRPDLVRGLALFEPVIVVLAAQAGSDLAKAQVARIASLMAIPIDDDAGRAWVEQFVDWWNGSGFFRSMPPAAQQAQVDTALQAHRQAACVGTSTVTTEQLSTLAVPTLLLVSELSPTAARESAGLAARAMRRARLEVVQGAGHMGPLTHAAVVNAAVLSFFDGLRAGPPA